ncbi:MAG: HEAT repeat domain-containing protein, partial [Chloroflexota bacterium]
RTWSIFNGNELQEEDEEQITFADRIHAYLKDILPVVDDVLPELKRAATVQLDRGFITLENLIDYALFKTETGEDPRLTRTLTQEVMALADTSELQVTEDLDDDARKEREKLSQEVSKEQTKLLERLVKAGILISFRGGRYQFKHKIIASYLAAIDLSDARPEIVYRKYVKPDWEYAMNYLAGMRDVDFLVAEHLDDDLDIRFEKILKLTNWLKYAPEDVPWRNNLLRYLGNVFASPNQFSVVRERVAAALVSSRDAGARVVFRRGIGTKNPDVRRLCCYALGASKDDGAIDALSQVVMQDPIIDNKIAGQMGLVAMGSEDALLTAIDLFDMASDEAVRRAVTENLAADHEVGYPTLKDMLESESITMRRAALYGTSRVNTSWAWILIDRIFQNDTESFVRLASEVVLRQKFETYFYELYPYPDALEMEWFILWEQTQKDFGVLAYDTEPEEAFEHAFSKSDKPEIRWLVTGTLGQIGEYTMVDKLYDALRDSDANIRDRAYRSLAEFQEQLGRPIPIPIT